MIKVSVKQQRGGSLITFGEESLYVEGTDKTIAGFIGLYLALDYSYYEPVCFDCWSTIIQAKAATFKTILNEEMVNAKEIFNLVGEAEDFFEQITPSKRNELIKYCK